jgi:WD40-like Beta Propeller Repeat
MEPHEHRDAEHYRRHIAGPPRRGVTSLLLLGLAVFVERPSGLPPIAFSVETNYRVYDVWVASDSSVQKLTDDQLSYAHSWSPDGQRIAFIRGEPDTW